MNDSNCEENLDIVDGFEIGGAFVDYCVGQGWLEKAGEGEESKYKVTEEGRRHLSDKFGIRF